MQVLIREAELEDVKTVAQLIQELAQIEGGSSAISPDYVIRYQAHPGNCVLLAESEGRVLGLLSYSISPDLFHAGDVCSIETLIVRKQARGEGVGGALMREVIRRAAASQCVEISVSTMPDNRQAISFYHKHGFGDEALLLERHL
jgi:PhnO protein